MKKTIAVIFLLIALLLPFSAAAKDNIVYIAGNPDMYPIEYYDEDEKLYKGVMPDIYSEISKSTDLELVYLNPSPHNNQERMAKNKQVDIVSAHMKSDVENLTEEITLATDKNGEICIGFTRIANNEVKEAVKNHLSSVDSKSLLSLTLDNSERKTDRKYIYYLVAAAFLLVAVTATLVTLIVRNRKKAKNDIANRMTDELTGLGNTEYFEYCCKKYITPSISSLYYAAYISIDIRELEKVLTSQKLEEMQMFAANAISSYAGDNDFFARISDGTFALCYQSVSKEQAQEYISSLLRIINETEKELFDEFKMSFRAGVYPLNNAGVSPQTLLLNARYGYNEAVEKNKPFSFSDSDLLKAQELKSRLQNDLLQAVKNEEFAPYMQFVANPKTGEICGAEVLARWNNPRDGLLTPAHFIASLKNAKIIDRIDLFIFEKCCEFLQNWDEGTSLNLSCNFTRFTISQNDFINKVEAIFTKYNFDRKRLVIELTEDSLEDDKTVAFDNIMFCKKSGFRIALDDFGAGYTSLNDLCNYPIDIIKVDRNIIKQTVTEKGRALLNSVVQMAHSLDIEVLCEGVETESENEVSIASGCDYIQGFYYSRVFPYEEAMKIYKKNNSNL